MNVFECEDLLYTILKFLGCNHLYLWKFINKAFSDTIRHHFPFPFSFLKNYCCSLNLFFWSIGEGECPLELWRLSKCMTFGAQMGSIGVVKWVRSRQPSCALNESICKVAAGGGHVMLLTWLRKLDPPCPWDAQACCAAAKSGNLMCLKWLRSQDPPCPWNESTCYAAASGGHLPTLQWLRAQDPPCLWDSRASYAAAGRGDLRMLQWLMSQDPVCDWDEWTCHAAARDGHLAVLQWLRAQVPPCPWSISCCTSAARAGHLHWLSDQVELGVHWDEHLSVRKSCEKDTHAGRLSVLQWLEAQSQ